MFNAAKMCRLLCKGESLELRHFIPGRFYSILCSFPWLLIKMKLK